MAPSAQTLYLIDGHAQLYRAYHAHARENRRATNGTPTGALYGFFNQVRSIRSRNKPQLLGCVFDPKGETFREKQFAGYKAHRAPMPDDLRVQVPLAFELCQAYGIPALQVEGFEADDVLGTLAEQATKAGYNVVIVTGDKDLLQLINPQVKVFDPMKDILYDEEKVEEVKGLKPVQIVDWLGLMGDAADNIPGVTGVGEQTAVKLLAEHGSLENTLAYYAEKFASRADEIRQFVEAHRAESAKEKEARQAVKPPKGLKVLDAYLFCEAEAARASRELARIRCDVPIAFEPEKFKEGQADKQQLVELLSKLDFRQFLREVSGGEELLTLAEQKAKDAVGVREYQTIDTSEKLTAFIKELGKQKRFALDTETTSARFMKAHLVGLSFSWEKNRAAYIPVRAPLGEPVLDEKVVLDALRPILENAKFEKVGQHSKYDLNVLRRAGVHVRGVVFDTLIGGWILDPGALRHDLDTLAYTHLGLRKTSTSSLIGSGKAPSMDFVPVADVARYACEDADLTWQLAALLTEKLAAANLTKLLSELEVPLIEVLSEMELTGIKVNADLLKEMSNTVGAQLAVQEEEIFKLAGERFTINSPKQLAHILFDKLGLESQGRTATGQQSTGEEVLQQLAKIPVKGELPKLILEYRQLFKLKNTYLDLLPEEIDPKTGRIHAVFNQTGAETGRLSSNDPNLQNIPVRSSVGRSIRAAFVAGEPGWKILTADYSQIELRVLAHYSQDPALVDAFAKNLDVHTAVAANLFGVPESKVTRDQRARAKTVNFGVIYGQTAFGLAQTLDIPQKEASEIIARFFERHAGVKGCLDSIIAEAREKGYVTTILGRRRFIPQLKERSQQKLGERIAVNTVFQGSAADLIKKAMLEIHRELHPEKARPGQGWKARMLLQIHDELLFETPQDEAQKLEKMVKDKMERALTLRVPLAVDVGIGDDWLGAKD